MTEPCRREVAAQELAQQEEACQRARGLGGGAYWIYTYGCQMNAHDSETLAGLLGRMGYEMAESAERADVILFNTCCVRDNAERRVYGNVEKLRALKQQRPELIVGVCGCMMQQQDAARRLLKSCPFVDLIFGTHNLYRFPEMLLRVLLDRQQVVEIDGGEGRIAEGLPVQRKTPYQAYLTIMYGCNNFCSYCIVPYVRGRERSRRLEAIVSEAEGLAAEGVQEIMLLGQNVNSYGQDVDGPDFPALLRRLNGIVPRIRFMTSHPKDLSDALVKAMRDCSSVCPHIHLPVQSGSDRILAAMNRRYTRAHYLERVAKLKEEISAVGLTTDIIAGFPGESEADFEQTLMLCQQANFDAAYTFIFSPRQGTRAAQMPGQVPEAVKHERLSRLIAQQEKRTAARLHSLIGQRRTVLVEDVSRRCAQEMTGRTGDGFMVNFPGGKELTGRLVQVTVEGAGVNTLRGQLIE